MTTKNLYSCYDEVANTWNDPFADFTDGSAVRSFTEFIRHNSDRLSTVHDLTLYRVGSWDAKSGVLVPDRHLVVSAASIISAASVAAPSEVSDHE